MSKSKLNRLSRVTAEQGKAIKSIQALNDVRDSAIDGLFGRPEVAGVTPLGTAVGRLLINPRHEACSSDCRTRAGSLGDTRAAQTAIVSLQATFKDRLLRFDLVVQGADRMPESLVKIMSDSLVAGLTTSLQAPGLDSLRANSSSTAPDPTSSQRNQNLDGGPTR